MSPESNKNLVEEFYDRLWNQWDSTAMEKLLSADILFRGSLGLVKKGVAEFSEYVDLIRSAFPDFRNTIEELIAEGDKVVARLTYNGTHRGELFGLPATGKKIEYSGVAIFHVVDHKISEVWVLGDLFQLMKQLTGDSAR